MLNLSKISSEERKARSKFTCIHRHNGFSHQNCFTKKYGLIEKERIGFLDIETTGLKADYGYILSYCIKTDNGKMYKQVISQDDIFSGRYDKRILKLLIKDLRNFDRVITYYGTNFDIPFIRSRCLFWKLPFLVYLELKHTDVYFIAKSKLRIHSNRLGVVCEFLGIPAKNHPMTTAVWLKCSHGNKKALQYVLTHNEEDAISLQKVWHRLLTFVTRPNKSI